MARLAAKRVEFSTPLIKGTTSMWIRGTHESGYDLSIDEDRRVVVLKPHAPGLDSERVPFEQVKKYVLSSQSIKDE